MENPSHIKLLPSYLLAFLWTYTGLDKLIRFEQSRKAFHNQTFPSELAEVLSYAVPIAEILLAILLVCSISRWWGYLGSLLLLTVFLSYVGLIWVGAFPRVPCNCAGLLDSMGWGAHMILNLSLMTLSIFGIFTETKITQKKKSDVSLTSPCVKSRK